MSNATKDNNENDKQSGFCGFDQKLFVEAVTTSAPSCDLSELYRQEILEVTNQIDALVANYNAGEKTGLITLSHEYFGKGRVKVIGRKWVAGKLFKTGKHLGLCPEQAELKVVKEIFKLLQDKYFPPRHSPNDSLEKYEHDLLQFSKETNLGEPVFSSYLLEGKYEMTLTVSSQVSHSGPADFMKDARAIAAKDWLQLYGGNWQQILDQTNFNDQSGGCLILNRNDIERCSPTIDVDNMKIIQSPILSQDKKQNEKKSNIFNYSDDPDVVEILQREKTEAKKVAKKAKKGSKYVNMKKSNIFNYYDNPDVVEILQREKAEAKKVAKKAKKGSKYLHGVEKMLEFSQRVAMSWKKNSKGFLNNCDADDFESPVENLRKTSNKDDKYFNGENPGELLKTTTLSQQLERLQDSPYSLPPSPSLMISPILSKKVSLLEDSQIEEDVDNDSNEYIPDLDELLKLPEKPTDGSKTKEEILNEFDQLIAERQRLHEEEMAQVDADIEAQKQKMADRKLRLKANAKLRNRLETELTEHMIRKMFQDNLQHLQDIWQGKVESSRHKAFHKSIMTRHALYYKIITDPFTDEHLDWMMDEITKVWMSNIRDQMDNNEYVWKVIVSECFIKFYMDFFKFSKEEAMNRISETPLHKKDRLKEFMNSSDESESDEEIEVDPEGTKVESLQTAVEGISKLKSPTSKAKPTPREAESTPSKATSSPSKAMSTPSKAKPTPSKATPTKRIQSLSTPQAIEPKVVDSPISKTYDDSAKNAKSSTQLKEVEVTSDQNVTPKKMTRRKEAEVKTISKDPITPKRTHRRGVVKEVAVKDAYEEAGQISEPPASVQAIEPITADFLSNKKRGRPPKNTKSLNEEEKAPKKNAKKRRNERFIKGSRSVF